MSKTSKKTALLLSRVLGACKLTGVDTTVFLPAIKIKAELNTISTDVQELEKSVFADLGIEMNAMGELVKNYPADVIDKANKAIREIHDEEIEVSDLKIFSEEDFTNLIKASDLNTAELALIYENMVANGKG